MPSASWLRDARSASTPLRRLIARIGLGVVALLCAAGTVHFSLPAEAQQGASGVITLTSQNAWVQTSSKPIRLGLRVHSSVAASDLSVNVAVYTEPDDSALASRDEFDATLGGQFAGLVQLSLSTFSLSALATGHGSLEFYAGGSGLPGKVPTKVRSDQVFQLPCPQRYGGCDGVYPLQVSLFDTLIGQSLDSFTTYLIVVPSAVPPQQRLRFSFVLPVGAPLALTAAGTSAVPRQTIARIDAIASDAVTWPAASLTVDLYGQTLLALARSHKHASLLAALTSGGLRTLVGAPFSAVNPTGLVRAGLTSELALQVGRGREVFSKVLHSSGTSRIYVATSPIGTHGLAALAADGIKQIVLPESNLQSIANDRPATVQWPYTLSAPFHIAGSSVEGLQADQGLASHLSGSGSSAALRAQQLLADLAELYFDSPNYPQARGVALVAPQSWMPQPGFLAATLQGLESSPVVSAVPIGRLFQTVPPGTCQQPPSAVTGCSPAVRSLATPSLASSGSITSGQVQTAYLQLAELSSVIPTDTSTIGDFDDAVLLAETAGLDPGTREAYLSASLVTMHALGSELTLPSGRTVTVTSSSARFPISITSSSRTSLHVMLVISGQNLTEPTMTPLVLDRGTTPYIVRVATRTSGDSDIHLQLLSPTGRFELARGEFTIRSTAISGVAIGLTAGAGAFLIVWWLRSALRRGRRRAGGHTRGTRQVPTTAAVPEPAS